MHVWLCLMFSGAMKGHAPNMLCVSADQRLPVVCYLKCPFHDNAVYSYGAYLGGAAITVCIPNLVKASVAAA